MSKSVAKIIRSGKSQSLRFPASIRVDSDEVLIERDGDKIVLSPRPATWKSFFASRKRPTKDFMSQRDDALPQARKEL